MSSIIGPASASAPPSFSEHVVSVGDGLEDAGTSIGGTTTPSGTNDTSVHPTADAAIQVGKDKPKKKKRGKNKASRGPTALNKKCGTGFEDYYCDPPMTPTEAAEEQTNIYAAHRPFVDRIEECIAHFRSRRQLDNDRTNMFDKYLALGGIDASPRQFQGMDGIEFDGETPAEIREIMSSDVIHRGAKSNPRFYNPNDSKHWDVDFAGVAAGFFSERITHLAGSDVNLIHLAVNVVQNFLNYVLHHDVCPEYSAGVMAAKEICAAALDQLPRILSLSWALPGAFNTAARTIFCRDNGTSATDDDVAESLKRHQRVFMATVATINPMIAQRLAKLEDVRIVDTAERTFEIEQTFYPSKVVAKCYSRVHDAGGEAVEPCGVAVLRPVIIRDGWDIGAAAAEEEERIRVAECETLMIESSILRQLEIGMKLRLVLCSTDGGLKFVKEFKHVYPSYYTFLPQELMLNYKEPVPNERPAPNADDLDEQEEGGNAKID